MREGCEIYFQIETKNAEKYWIQYLQFSHCSRRLAHQ